MTEISKTINSPLGWDVELEPESLLEESESLPLPEEELLEELDEDAVELESVVVD